MEYTSNKLSLLCRLLGFNFCVDIVNYSLPTIDVLIVSPNAKIEDVWCRRVKLPCPFDRPSIPESQHTCILLA